MKRTQNLKKVYNKLNNFTFYAVLCSRLPHRAGISSQLFKIEDETQDDEEQKKNSVEHVTTLQKIDVDNIKRCRRRQTQRV